MKAKWVVLSGIFCLVCATGILIGQEKEDRTLLSHDQMTAIINEVSGERAMHTVLDLVPYQFVRPPSEYQTHFRESEVMAKYAREYGLSNVVIEDDSGIPYHYFFEPPAWNVHLFGAYDEPIGLFKSGLQDDLKAAYDAHTGVDPLLHQA